MTRKSKRGNGLGSICWDASKQALVGRITLGDSRKKVYGPRGDRSSAAYQVVERKLAKYIGAAHVADGNAPLKQFLEEYADRAELAPKTRDNYHGLIDNHLERLGAKKLIDVEPIDIKTTLAAINGDRTRQQVRHLLHGVFKEALQLEIVQRNPVDNTKPVKYRRAEKRRRFSLEELPFLLKAAREDKRYGAMVVLSLATGLGPAELYGLQRRDLDLGNGFLRVERDCVEAHGADGKRHALLGPPKTENRRRTVLLPAVAIEALRAHLQYHGKLIAEGDGTEQVFTAPKGGLILHRLHTRRWWKPLLEKAAALAAEGGLAAFDADLGMYAMRHTFNALGGLAGVEQAVRSKAMGHSRMSVTYENYTDPLDQQYREAADAMDGTLRGLTGTNG